MPLDSLRRVVRNAISLLASNMVNRATTFALYALVGRYLGAFEFGQMSLALTFFYLFQVFAIAGLRTLITREVAKDRAGTDRYLVNGSATVVVASLASIAILWLLVRLMGYSPDTASVILLMSLALIPYALSVVCESVFQAWERMHYIAYANAPVNVAKLGIAFWLLAQGYGLYHLVLLLLASHAAVALVEWLLIVRSITRPRAGIDVAFLLSTARATTTFLGIDGIIAITTSANVLLLSRLAGETEVGLYSAASQLMVPMMLLFQGVALSVFPIMARRFEPTFRGLRRISLLLLEMMLAVAMPTAIGLAFLAGPALSLLYGKGDLLMAAGVLRVMGWNLLPIAATSILGQVLLAGLRERAVLRIVAVDALVSLVTGLILIGQFGLMGAAAAALLTRLVDFGQHYLLVGRLLSGISLGSLIWKPLVAGMAMAACLAAMREQNFFLAAASAAMVYAGVLLLLALWSYGGPGRLKARLLNIQSE